MLPTLLKLNHETVILLQIQMPGKGGGWGNALPLLGTTTHTNNQDLLGASLILSGKDIAIHCLRID